MNRSHLLVAALLAALTLTRSSAWAAPITIERIAAVVNTEIILLSEVKERAAQSGQTLDEHAGSPIEKRQVEQALKAVTDKMVDDVLVIQQAGELKLAVEEAEIDRAIDEVKKQNKLDQEAFVRALSEQGYTLSSYRKDLRKQLLRLKVINTAVRARISVSDEEVKAFYDQSARQAGDHKQAHVRHVLIAVPPGSDVKTVEKKRLAAAKVLEQARAGQDFAKLASQFSDDAATKDVGGDLGWVKQGEGIAEAMAEVIFAMDEANEVRGPIRTERGFEVLQLIEKKDSDVRPFAEVKEQIRQQLYTSQMEKQTQLWLSELRKKAHVDVRL
ncbi:MAG: hypothetical protein EXR72_25755 [Myxococcales bacterium]|nr:hypothetical protein [Myxococcales bacterium]